MNIFKTTDNGGLPFVLDDIRFEQDAVREAFFGLTTSWGLTAADSYVLNGVVVTAGGGGTYNITAGFIVLEGEIFKVDAQTSAAVGGGQFLQWEIEETNDPAGLKTFFSAASFDTYKIRRLKANVVGAVTTLNALTAQTIHQKIAQNTATINGVFTNYDLLAYADIQGNSAASGTGSVVLLSQLPSAGSYIKTNVVGKVINITFQINTIITRRQNTDGDVVGIVLALPGGEVFKSLINQWANYYALCSSHTDSLSGTHLLRTIPGTDKIVFGVRLPQSSSVSFNRQYQLDTTPSKNYIDKGIVDQFHTWSFYGSATFELD